MPSGKRAYRTFIEAVNAGDGPVHILSVSEKWSPKKPLSPGRWQSFKTLIIEYQNRSNDIVYLCCEISHPREDGMIVTIPTNDSVCPPGVIRKRPFGNGDRRVRLTLSRVLVLNREKEQIYLRDTDLRFRRGGTWLGQTFCVVATTCFEDENAAEVEILRRFRDRVLFESLAGRAAIRLYEHLGPPVARLVNRHPALRRSLRSMLSRLSGWLGRRYGLS